MRFLVLSLIVVTGCASTDNSDIKIRAAYMVGCEEAGIAEADSSQQRKALFDRCEFSARRLQIPSLEYHMDILSK